MRVTTPRQRLERQLRLTRLIIAAERGLRLMWPVLPVTSLYVALQAFGILALVSPFMAGVLQGLMTISLLVISVRAGILFRIPSREEAIARIDAQLQGHPLATLEDRIAVGAGDAQAEALWTAHLARMAERAASVRTGRPDVRLSAYDPFALRLIAIVLLVVTVLFARGSLGPAVAPVGGAQATVNTGLNYEGWATPPAYTGLPTLYLPDLAQAGAELRLPAGSDVSLRIYGAAAAKFAQTLSSKDIPLIDRAPGIQDVQFQAEQSGALILGLEDQEVAWRFEIIDDLPPEIRFLEGPSRSPTGLLEMTFEAQDDYEVRYSQASVTLNLEAVDRRYGLKTQPVTRPPLLIELPMPLSGDRMRFIETVSEDFSDHPLAGLPVEIILEARDAMDQPGRSASVQMILPMRRFFDPLAAALVEQRRDLLWSPENATRVSRLLRAITHEPEYYDLPAGAYLGIRTAIERLDLAREDDAVSARTDEIAQLLWDMALLIEDGALSDAEQRLQQAQERLSQALEENASDEEIAELMEELRRAMENYMEQMARELLENEEQRQAQNNAQGPQMDSQDLQDILDQIQELSEAGEREAAQALLEQLQRMMENMQMALQDGDGNQQQGQGTQQNLQDMLREQQDLADDSFQELQRQFRDGAGQEQSQAPGQQRQSGEQGTGQGEPGDRSQNPGGSQGGDMPQSSGDGLGSLADRQEALRGLLEQLQDALPNTGTEAGRAGREALDEAERNMADARDALEDGNGRAAIDDQAQAMENMRQAMRDLGQEAREQSRQQAESQAGQGQEFGDPQGEWDPLGRPAGANGEMDGRDTRIPDPDDIGRSRALADELRRRAGERDRSASERDYLERLLERF